MNSELFLGFSYIVLIWLIYKYYYAFESKKVEKLSKNVVKTTNKNKYLNSVEFKLLTKNIKNIGNRISFKTFKDDIAIKKYFSDMLFNMIIRHIGQTILDTELLKCLISLVLDNSFHNVNVKCEFYPYINDNSFLIFEENDNHEIKKIIYIEITHKQISSRLHECVFIMQVIELVSSSNCKDYYNSKFRGIEK